MSSFLLAFGNQKQGAHQSSDKHLTTSNRDQGMALGLEGQVSGVRVSPEFDGMEGALADSHSVSRT